HWNGSQWTVVPSPTVGAGSGLSAVTAKSANDAWAAGGYTDVSGQPSRSLVLHWDGAQWSVVPSPNMGSGDNYLRGLAAVSSSDVWAVGDYTAPAARTLALH